MSRTRSALIAGAGIGGLATAIALRRIGMSVRIAERRTELAEEGAGLQLGPNAVAVLQRLGVAERLQSLAFAPNRIVMRDGASGALVKQFPLGGWIAGRHGAPYWTLHRVDLHEALRKHAEALGLTLETGCDIRGVSDRANGASATTGAGATIDSDLVIGADGLWSRVRADLFDTAGPVPTGLFAARATLPRSVVPSATDVANVGVWVMPDAHVVHYPVRGGAEVNIVVVLRGALGQAETWSLPLTSSELMTAAKNFAAPLRALLALVPSWLRWPLLGRDPLATYVRRSVALVGDAAHPTFPFFAQGAAMAIEDAEALAASLSFANRPVQEALRVYDELRRPHTQRLVHAASENGRIYHLDGTMRLARNAALAVIPGSILMARYDWIYRDKRPVLNN